MPSFEQNYDNADLKEIFEAMIASYGRDVFMNRRKALGSFLDIAPKLTRGARCLDACLKAGNASRLASAGTSKAREQEARAAVNTLKEKGFDDESAFSFVENLCEALGGRVSIRPDYSKGGDIPYAVKENTNIQDAMESLDHVRWFLNHEKDYHFQEPDKRIGTLRSLMGRPTENRQKILDIYKDICREFVNDPYSSLILLEDADAGGRITALKPQDYFVVINGMPVPVGFARKWKGADAPGDVAFWNGKKKAFLQKVDGLKARLSGVAETKSNSYKKAVSEGIRYIFFGLLVAALLGYFVYRETSGGLLPTPMIAYIRNNFAKKDEILSLFESQSAVRDYLVRAGVLVLAVVFGALLLLNILRVMGAVRRRRKKMRAPLREKKNLLRILEKDMASDIGAIEKAFEKDNAEAKLKVCDYRSTARQIRELSAGTDKPVRRVVGKPGKLLCFLAAVICGCYALMFFGPWPVEYERGQNMLQGINRSQNSNVLENTAALSDEKPEGGTWTDWKNVKSFIRNIFEAGAADGLYEVEKDAIYDRKAAPLSITQTSESSCLDNNSAYGAAAAVDGDYYTFWQEGAPGDGIGEFIRLEFDGKKKVALIDIVPGNVRSRSLFEENNRPKLLSFRLGDKEYIYEFPDGEMREFLLSLPGEMETDHLEIEILDVYKGSAYEDTCITEVTVYG